MQGYPTYKDSGNSWFGHIPDHWTSINFRLRLSTLTDFTANGSFASLAKNVNYLEEGFSRLVRLTDLRTNLEGKGIYVSEDAHNFLKKSELYGGEILLANVGAYAGLITRMPYKEGNYTLGPNMFLIRVEGNIDFYTYQLSSYPCNEQLMLKAMSAAQPKLNKEDVRSIRVAIPSDEEQQSIANFLDHQTAQIDQAIADKEQLLELYEEEKKAIINQAVTKGLDPTVPMKGSGVEWLGEVPEHWVVSRVGYVSKVVRGASPRPAGDASLFNGDFMPWITVKEVTNSRGKFILETETYLTELGAERTRILEPETLILSNSGATLGVPRITLIKGAINDGSVAFLNLTVEREFLYYFFTTHTKIYRDETSGYGQPNLNTEIVKSTKIPLPPNNEQREIIDYIESKIEQFRLTESIMVQEVELLKEYKQSLIFEAVTGKIDVRDFELKD